MKFVLIDCCPVPTAVAPLIREVKKRSGQVLVSCYRGHDARAQLHRCGKRSQLELYVGWKRRLRGFNPANPPGRSTHELRSDGYAYAGPPGRRLRSWQVGQDWTNAYRVVQTYRRMGVIASITYPNQRSERHHINIRKQPKLAPRTLKRGDKGLAVTTMTRRLAYVKSPSTQRPYLSHKRRTFTATVERALKHYQRDHGLKADGRFGPQTRHQLAMSTGYWKRRRGER